MYSFYMKPDSFSKKRGKKKKTEEEEERDVRNMHLVISSLSRIISNFDYRQ